MSAQVTSIDLQMQLAGTGWLLGQAGFSELGTSTYLGSSWTSITDVVISGGLNLTYGISGSGPADRVASTGTMTFSLDNSTSNSAGLLGYYSPNNANKRSGFELGIGVRLAITYGGITYYKWRGFLTSIEPLGGIKRDRLTNCVAVDYMDDAASSLLNQVALQINKRSDEVFTAVYNNLARPAPATSIGTGVSTFAYALDNVQDESTTALSAFQTIAASEVGFIYLKGDTTQGSTLVFENRTARQAAASSATISNDMIEMTANRSMKELLNRIKVTSYPREVDAAATTVLYSLSNANTTVASGVTLTIDAAYTDPNQKAARVGGTEMVTPVATTDYTMNTLADGTGTNLTASFTVTPTFGANSARLVIANGSGSDGFITFLQLRGKGIYTYDATISTSQDTESQYLYGINTLSYDMPYQDTLTVGQSAADYFKYVYKNPLTYLRDITIDANASSTLLSYALAREISDRITVSETVTGLSADYFINSVNLAITANNQIAATWTLAPSAGAVWLLGTAGSSELGSTTVLGF